MLAFFGVNNYAIYNHTLQTTKGGVESAMQTFSKQFFSTCVSKGNSLSNCASSQGTVSSIFQEVIVYSVQQSMLRDFPTNTPTVNLKTFTVTINDNYIQVEVDFQISNIHGLIMPALTPGLDSIIYQSQTVINKNMNTI